MSGQLEFAQHPCTPPRLTDQMGALFDFIFAGQSLDMVMRARERGKLKVVGTLKDFEAVGDFIW